MRFCLLAFITILTLSGCKTDETPRYKDVYVPVYVVPAPPKVQRPELEIDKLTDEQRKDPGVVLRAHNASDQQIISYAKQLELIVARYATLAEQSQNNLNTLTGNAPLKLEDKTDSEWNEVMKPVVEKND